MTTLTLIETASLSTLSRLIGSADVNATESAVAVLIANATISTGSDIPTDTDMVVLRRAATRRIKGLQ